MCCLRLFRYAVIIWTISLSGLIARTPYEYLADFCRIGTRVPGTLGHRKARDFIMEHCTEPQVDSFPVDDIWFYNIYQRFGHGTQRIGLAAHWDSDIGCPGANDGGSGVAVLLSVADTLSKNPPSKGVDILFFDGEDVEKAELIGSQHFAATCVNDYSFVIVFDMIGDADLQIFQEGHSAECFGELVDSLWYIGMEVAPQVFVPIVKYYIIDDHISLIKYGIRAVNVIDFDYPYWDTKEDTFDKCSMESLTSMYEFILKLVY
jgi:glutaminyl-peptide cyclotransferase